MNIPFRFIVIYVLTLISTNLSASDFYLEINKDIPDKIISKICPNYPCDVLKHRGEPRALNALGSGYDFDPLSFNESALEYTLKNYNEANSFLLIYASQVRDIHEKQQEAATLLLNEATSEENLQYASVLLDKNLSKEMAVEMFEYTIHLGMLYFQDSQNRFDDNKNEIKFTEKEMNILKIFKKGMINTNREQLFLEDNRLHVFGLFEKLKKSWRKFTRWTKKQLKKGFDVGKTELNHLTIRLNESPDIDVANPIRLKNLDVTPIFKITQHYVFMWRKGRISIGSSSVTTNLDISALLGSNKTPNVNMIWVRPEFKRFKLKFKILGFPVKVGLTGIANKLIEGKQWDIFDVNGLLIPFDPVNSGLGLQLGLEDFHVPESRNNLKILIELKVKKQ